MATTFTEALEEWIRRGRPGPTVNQEARIKSNELESEDLAREIHRLEDWTPWDQRCPAGQDSYRYRADRILSTNNTWLEE